MNLIGRLSSPFGIAVVVHGMCERVGMSEFNAYGAGFLVWLSCAAMLFIVLSAIESNRSAQN